MFPKSSNVHYTEYYDQTDPRVAQRVRSKRQDERNSTSSQRRHQTSSNLVRARKVMEERHRQAGGVGGVRQASLTCENHIVGSKLLSKRTHAKAQSPVEYPSEKPLEGKLPTENITRRAVPCLSQAPHTNKSILCHEPWPRTVIITSPSCTVHPTEPER